MLLWCNDKRPDVIIQVKYLDLKIVLNSYIDNTLTVKKYKDSGTTKVKQDKHTLSIFFYFAQSHFLCCKIGVICSTTSAWEKIPCTLQEVSWAKMLPLLTELAGRESKDCDNSLLYGNILFLSYLLFIYFQFEPFSELLKRI